MENIIDSYLQLVDDPKVCPPIAIVYIDSYYAMNVIHATHIWMFLLPILDVFIECENRLDIGMGASTLMMRFVHVKCNGFILHQNQCQSGGHLLCPSRLVLLKVPNKILPF
jgi:hypothetical protein